MNRIYFLFAFLFFILSPSHGECAPQTGSSPEFAKIQKLVLSTHAKSAKDIVALLPKEFRQRFTFVYESHALHPECIDPANPRVILFNSDKSVALSFPWKADTLPICNVIEMMEIAPNKKSLELNLYDFANTSKPVARGVHSPVNCQSCHGADPHPIWQSYRTWDGIYGSDDDILENPAEPNGFAPNLVSENEFKNYGSFFKAMSAKEKAMFIWPQVPSDAINLAPDQYALPPYYVYGLSNSVDGDALYRPNLALSVVTNSMNAVLLNARLSSTQFEKYRLLLSYMISEQSDDGSHSGHSCTAVDIVKLAAQKYPKSDFTHLNDAIQAFNESIDHGGILHPLSPSTIAFYQNNFGISEAELTSTSSADRPISKPNFFWDGTNTSVTSINNFLLADHPELGYLENPTPAQATQHLAACAKTLNVLLDNWASN